MLEAYRSFLEGERWDRRELEFADFSEADLSEIEVKSLKKLCEFIGNHYQRHGITEARCASWIPRDINQSLLEIYNYLSKQSPAVTRVFAVKSSALDWLLSSGEQAMEMSA